MASCVRTPHTELLIREGSHPVRNRADYPKITDIEDHRVRVGAVTVSRGMRVVRERKIVWMDDNGVAWLDWVSDLERPA